MECITFQDLAEKFDKTKQELLECESNLQYLIRLRYNKSPNDNKWYESKFDKHENYEPDDAFESKYENKFDKHESFEPDDKFQRKKLDNSCLLEDDDGDSDGCSLKNCSLQSAVVKNVTHSRSRRDAIHKQNIDARIKSRNRRILGMLQCTLKKFQVEAIRRKCQDMKRIKIEQKVEAAQIKEREEREHVNQRIIELRETTRQKHFQLDCLEKKMDLVKSHELWKENQSHLLNFMMTDAEPKIFFLPIHHTETSKKLHKESKVKILEIIEKHDTKMKEELLKYKNSDPSEFTKVERLQEPIYTQMKKIIPYCLDENDNFESLNNNRVSKIKESAHTNNYSSRNKKKIANELSMQLKKYNTPGDKDNSESLNNNHASKIKESAHAKNYSSSKKKQIDNKLSMQLKKDSTLDEKDNSESLNNNHVSKIKENAHANNYSSSKKRKIANELSMQLKKYTCT